MTTMRTVIHLVDDDPAEPPGLDHIETEWYPGGGNVHVVDDGIEQIAETITGDVIIEPEEGEMVTVEGAIIATVYPNE